MALNYSSFVTALLREDNVSNLGWDPAIKNDRERASSGMFSFPGLYSIYGTLLAALEF
jgi:hypothetical protein